VLRRRAEVEAGLLAGGEEAVDPPPEPLIVSAGPPDPARAFRLHYEPDERLVYDFRGDPERAARGGGDAAACLSRCSECVREDMLRLLRAERSGPGREELSGMTLVAIEAGETELKAALADFVLPAVRSTEQDAPSHDPGAGLAARPQGATRDPHPQTLSACVEALRATAAAGERVRPRLASFFTTEYVQALLDTRYAEGWAALDRLRRDAAGGEPRYHECVRVLLGNETVTGWVAQGGPGSGAPPDEAVLHRLLAGRSGPMDSG
jgi:hypothetical protein